MAQPRILTTNILLGKQAVSVEALDWKCHLTTYGNLCTFEVRLPIATLKKVGYDIFAEQNANPTLECQIQISESGAPGGIIFDGVIDRVEGTWEDDILEIEGRDYSAVLRDQQAALVNYQGQLISQAVQSMVDYANKQAGTQIQTNISPTPGLMAGIKSNYYQGEEFSFSTQPKPYWHIIQELADEAGYVAYMDQHKTLNFVPCGNGKQWTYYWRKTPTQIEQTSDSILHLTMTQQSRRYNNFTLWVHGNDDDAKQTFWTKKVSGDGSGRLIVIRRSDLNTQNYDQIAQNELEKIQQKNTVVKMVVDGNYNLNLNDKMQVLESNNPIDGAYTTVDLKSQNSTGAASGLGDLLGLSGRGLYVVSFVHQFSMPDYGSDTGDGFLTQITCNQLGSSSGSD
jgi:hypothetical protein